MEINALISKYVMQAEEHNSLDSFDGTQVKKGNKLAKKMLKTADLIYTIGGSAEFEKLLNHKTSGVRSWAAFNLIERMNPTKEQLEKAIKVIENLANSDSIDASGAKLWLENWNNNQDQ